MQLVRAVSDGTREDHRTTVRASYQGRDRINSGKRELQDHARAVRGMINKGLSKLVKVLGSDPVDAV